jgi:hypothetical protein
MNEIVLEKIKPGRCYLVTNRETEKPGIAEVVGGSVLRVNTMGSTVRQEISEYINKFAFVRELNLVEMVRAETARVESPEPQPRSRKFEEKI